MKNQNCFACFFLIIYILSCSFPIVNKEKSIRISLLKASSNYPTERLDWYNAPPDIEFIFEIFNTRDNKLVLPVSTRDYHAENVNFKFFALINCHDSTFQLNLYKVSGSNNFIEIPPKSSKKVATKIHFNELNSVFEKCDEFSYMGHFLEAIALKSQIKYYFINKTNNNTEKDISFYFERSETFSFETLDPNQ